MGADDRVFAGLRAALPELHVPAWPAPKPRERLADYARRFASTIDPGCPCFVGGASFGGFVALEMLPHVRALGCFLIGSVRSSAELPAAVKALRRLAPTADALPVHALQSLAAVVLASSRPVMGRHLSALSEQFTGSEAAYLRWAAWAVLTWDGPAVAATVPIHQIHGDRDRVLPATLTHADVIVPGAGHALSMSHPEQVARFVLAAI